MFMRSIIIYKFRKTICITAIYLVFLPDSLADRQLFVLALGVCYKISLATGEGI